VKTKFKIPVIRDELVNANSLEELVDKFTRIWSWVWQICIWPYTISIESIPNELNYCIDAINDWWDWHKYRDFDDIIETVACTWVDEQRQLFMKECKETFRDWFMKSIDNTHNKK